MVTILSLLFYVLVLNTRNVAKFDLWPLILQGRITCIGY